MSRLNYHHLHYFWAVAKQGNLTRAAEQLRVSQSALSTQIRQLEEQLGQPLFTRQGRSLLLTEPGRIALTYAEQIFASGTELVATLRDGRGQERQVLRIGAVATLSRNFQTSLVRPLLDRSDVELVLQSGSLSELLTRLSTHTLDLVLSNRSVQGDAENGLRCQRIARQPVSLVGPPRRRREPFKFPEDMTNLPLIVPSTASDIRTAFDLLCEQLDVRRTVLAEVDDMAMLRLLARGANAAAVVPTVVVRDELREGRLEEYCKLPNLYENFFAISIKRHFQQPLVKTLLSRSEAEVLAGAEPSRARKKPGRRG
jgi:LysR family transcriptional activator of nhaA